MKKGFVKLILLYLGVAFLWCNPAFATPALQLDIGGGFYNPETGGSPLYDTETIVANSNPFDLYALLIPDKDALLTDTYYISAALFRQGGVAETTPSPSLGSFKFGTETTSGITWTTILVTEGMEWGTPPADTDGDLPTHGIYETYYTEFEVNFSESSNKAPVYNSQDTPGGPASYTAPEAYLYYEKFIADISGLAEGYSIHFDFYSVNDDGSMKIKAPLSHDAQSGYNTPGEPGTGPAPEPATLILFGVGLIGLAGVQRKFTKR